MKVIFHISRVDSQPEANLPLPRISLKTPNEDTFDMYSRNCAFDATLGVVRYHFPTAEVISYEITDTFKPRSM